jgi:hypothetical protein
MAENYEEDLYFGDKYGYLYPCTGIFRSYKKEYIQQDDINEESVKETLKYSDDCSYIKPEYKDHYIPVVPETNVHFKNENLKDDENEEIDNILKQPLIKAKEIKDYPGFKCIISGHRSALIKDPKTGIFYRLKGCGNDELGFNIQKTEGVIVEIVTRGSQYDSTCFRELFYSEKVDENLKKINIRCANLPVGFWKYGKDLHILPKENIKKEDIPNLENQMPEVDKYCGIFHTLGDKRLRTHLLCGFEKILETIATLCVSKKLINEELLNEIKKIFPATRLPDKIETFKTIKFFGPLNTTIDEWVKKPVYEQKHYDAIISVDQLKKEINENKNLKIFIDQTENYDEIYNLLSENLSEKHKLMTKKIIENMKKEQANGKKFFSTLLNIYIRIGYEVGKIKRLMQDADINWGSYIDRGSSYHCNAHSNNLVVLPQGNDSLLSPLDLDLAFSKEKMIIINKDCPTYGQQDLSYWDNYINAEFVDLSLNLCGAEDYNFHFEKNKNKNPDSLESKTKNAIRFLLCDCMLENYMKGYDKLDSKDVISIKELKEDNFFHDIVKLALVVTAEDIA